MKAAEKKEIPRGKLKHESTMGKQNIFILLGQSPLFQSEPVQISMTYSKCNHMIEQKDAMKK